MELQLTVVIGLVLILAWANGANDMSKGVATLMGSGAANAKSALIWGTFCTLLGGLAAIVWGAALIKNFGGAYLTPDFPITSAFLGGSMFGACLWLLISTWLGWPVSTTHALLGSLVGGALVQAGPDGLQTAVITHKALLPLLISPVIAIFLCAGILSLSRFMAKRMPSWQQGCCDAAEWEANPYLCATRERYGQLYRFLPRIWSILHWLSGGATSFARGLNDVPKIAAILILALGLLPSSSTLDRQTIGIVAIIAVTVMMSIGGLWGGFRVLQVLAHRVVPVAAGTGLAANVGTSMLVLLASPLGIPVSTTHVSTGALIGIRLTDKSLPEQGDSLRWILFAWVVTLPITAVLSALSSLLFL